MRLSPHFGATFALLSGTLFLTGLADRRIPEPLAAPLDGIRTNLAGWTAVRTETLSQGVLKQLDPTSYLSRVYKKGPTEMSVFIAFYAQQKAGESMHSPKHCLPGAGWEIWKHDSADIPVQGRMVRINKYSIQNLGTRMQMFYWYQSRSRIVASEYLAKVLLARDTVLTGRTSGSIVRIMLPDAPTTSEEGIAVAKELISEVQRSFGGSDTDLSASGR